jgi:DSBA-like thioredoxin domain
VNVVVYGDFNCLLCYLASQRVDQLAGTGAAGIEWRAVERGAASARREQEVAQAEALALRGERLPASPPPALSSTTAAVAAYAEAITDGIQDELRRRLFDAIWVRGQKLSSAYDVRRVVTAITWPTPPVYFHLASPDLPLPLLHDPDPVRIVRRSGGTVTVDGGPLTSTGYRRCRDWQEQWLSLPRQVTPAVIGPDGTVHVGADGLRCLAAIMVAARDLPGRERVAQAGPALG